MREPLFIKKNKEKWESYDAEFTNDPNVLSERFTHILDDLAYAQTFYPKGKTVQYLNERAVNFYNQIYKKKKEPLHKIFDFWKIDLPLVIRRNHQFLFIALLLSLAAYFFGFVSANSKPDFFDSISPGYLEMTRDNIADGNPFGVYGNSNATDMFFRIAFNNISIAFVYDFIGGIFFCIASIFSLAYNGLMVGGFHYMFYEADLGWEFGLVVMIHGTFELFAFVVAAAAGFRLFNSIIFTGTYSRIESIKKGFSDGMQIMVLVFIMLFIAALLESYVTRLSAASIADNPQNKFIPIWASIFILATSVGFILWYFWLYPIIVARKYKKEFYIISAEQNIGKVSYTANND